MNAITVNDVTKIYKLYDNPIDRLKEALNPFHKQYHEPFYALKHVSFQVGKGETVGIIGTNGSGKSTILKIITGVLQQSSGVVEVQGNVSALLELGAGFDMDYTGIENIYMNGAILGFSREEMDIKKDEILNFADIGDFVNRPVKTYSSGMLVRLAFALAINVEPEILIIDEALAVGDAFFQAKCYNKLEEIKNSGTTILFVSHDIFSVKKLCSRAIWIDKGNMIESGEANGVCEKYLSAQIENNNRVNEELVSGMEINNIIDKIVKNEREKAHYKKISTMNADAVSGTGKAHIMSFYIKNEDGKEVNVLFPDEVYNIGIVAGFEECMNNVILGVELENLKGVRLFGINNFMSGGVLKRADTEIIYEMDFKIKLPRICKGEYLITLAVASGSQDNHVVHERIHNFRTLFIENAGYNIAIIDIDAAVEMKEYQKKLVTFID